ncbi:LPS export ABC transporter permease LptG [Tistrella bauzanensis]|uniref:LPS export ABC transporter permease LptG n=1 Tax=Tistrella TaxID=171436 RepID=UPI0031F61FC3
MTDDTRPTLPLPQRLRAGRAPSTPRRHISPTLSLYFARHMLGSVGLVLGVVIGLVLVVDLIELLRRASGNGEANLATLIGMALLKNPFQIQRIAPFAVLIGGLITFARLTRSNELVVARAAGVSVWQFMGPPLGVALLLGLFLIGIFNPLAALMSARYEALEARYIGGQSSLLSVGPGGLWLRERLDGQPIVIHATKMAAGGTDLGNVTIFRYDSNEVFEDRIDATRAQLTDDHWRLENAVISAPDEVPVPQPVLDQPTRMTREQILDSFANPETMSFWALPGFIAQLRDAGFSAVQHRLYWHSLLALPLLMVAMVITSAAFGLRFTRRGGAGITIAGGVFTGFLLYFLTGVVYALGQSGGLPVVLAAWTPAGVATLFGIATLMHLEDG